MIVAVLSVKQKQKLYNVYIIYLLIYLISVHYFGRRFVLADDT